VKLPAIAAPTAFAPGAAADAASGPINVVTAAAVAGSSGVAVGPDDAVATGRPGSPAGAVPAGAAPGRGAAPGVGAKLRTKLQTALDDTFARFLECLAHQRRRARVNHAGSQERRAILRKAADGFDLEVRLTYPEWFLDELRRLQPSVIDDA